MITSVTTVVERTTLEATRSEESHVLRELTRNLPGLPSGEYPTSGIFVERFWQNEAGNYVLSLVYVRSD